MVAIFTGAGAGFERGSGAVLGGAGLLGSATLGRSGEQVMLNAATGNLVISQQDEFLVGRGPDAAATRTYNSLGNLADGDGQPWHQSGQRQIRGLTGAVNTDGSTVKRVSGDGSVSVYRWNGSAYVSTEGGGAYDRISFDGTWRWVDGDSQVTETYAGPNGRISQLADTSGNVLTYGYAGDRLASITTADGGQLLYQWSGDTLLGVTTRFTPDEAVATYSRQLYWLFDAVGDRSPDQQGFYFWLARMKNGASLTEVAEHFYASAEYAGRGAHGMSDAQFVDFAFQSILRRTADTPGRTFYIDQLARGMSRGAMIAHISESTEHQQLAATIAGRTAPSFIDITRTYYEYDGRGRLAAVLVDLTPDDNSISDGQRYVTRYGYVGESNLVASITETDGTRLDIGYDGASRVTSLVQTVADGVTRVTTIAYGTDHSIVTDPQGQTVRLDYASDGSGAARQLTRITTPAAGRGMAATAVTFDYDGSGNLTGIIDGLGATTRFTYDGNGNVLVKTDPLGGTTRRTYNAANQLLTETVTASDAAQWSAHRTTRYAYDGANRLRYIVDAAGGLTEYAYDGAGQVFAVNRFAGPRYDIAGWNDERPLDYDAVVDWVRKVDKTNGHVTHWQFDGRGNVTRQSTYAATGSDGSPRFDEGFAEQLLTHDQAGRLLTRTVSGQAQESFVYDGLGRVIASTDAAGGATRIAFDDGASRTVVTLASGLVRTSTYDRAGELVAETEGGSFADGTTTRYRYDSLGRVRGTTDADGTNHYYLYDRLGRKVAEVNQNGWITEYRYDAADRLVATVRYTNALADWQMAAVTDPAQSPDIADMRPTAHSQDIWMWTVHDPAGKVIETIGGDGAVTFFEYDAAGQPTRTTVFANRLSSEQVQAFKTGAAVRWVLPAASTDDSLSRQFYDRAGRLIGTMDGDGRLSRIDYDAMGEKIAETRFANRVATHLRADGSFDACVESVGTDLVDATSRWVYDGQGLVRFEIDSLGGVTEYVYDRVEAKHVAYGPVRRTIHYAGTIAPLATYSMASVRQALQAAGLVGKADNRVTSAIYDDAGRLTYAIDAEGGVTGYRYDQSGRVIRKTQYAGRYDAIDLPSEGAMDSWAGSFATDAATRVTRHYYSARGSEIRFTIDAEGYVTRYDYDGEGRQTVALTWDSPLPVTDAWTIDMVNASRGADWSGRWTTYDADGRVASTRDSAGDRTDFSYWANGNLAWEIRAPGTDQESRVHHVYDATGRETTRYDAYGKPEQRLTHYAYDAFGRVATLTDHYGRKTRYEYDHVGQLISETDALGGVTSYLYDGLGNRIRKTDALGNQTWTYHDRLGRVAAVRDGDGYVTETRYTDLGDVASVTRRANRSYIATGPGWPETAPNSADSTTRFAYDRLGRVVKTIDAEGYIEHSWYDAFGQVVQVQNKLGGVTRRQYDRRGLLVAETLPSGSTDKDGNILARASNITTFDPVYYAQTYPDVAGMANAPDWLQNHWQTWGRKWGRNPNAFFNTSDYLAANPDVAAAGVDPLEHYRQHGMREGRRPAAQASTTSPALAGGVTNRFYYDARGNLVRKVEAETLPEQRTTRYSYDKADRLVETRGDAVLVVDQTSHHQQSSAEPVGRMRYDARGNVVETTDPRGARMLFWYDQLDRRIAALDTNGTLTRWDFDAVGNVVAQRVYETAVTDLPKDGSAPAAPTGGAVRETLYSYDALNRLTESAITNLLVGTWDDSRFRTFPAWSKTHYDYDAMGNILRVVDGAGGETFTTYDGLGRRMRQVDAEGYVTYWRYDAEGNVMHERRAAQRSPSYGLGSITDPDWDSADRFTEFTYDHMGRRVSETRSGLEAYSLDDKGVLTRTTAEATIKYSYNGLGQVTRKTETIGDATDYAYDTGGRLLTETKPGYMGSDGTTVRPELRYRYNGLGDLTRTEQTYGAGTDMRVTSYSYSAGGRLHGMVDAAGTAFTYWHDIAGALLLQTWDSVRADGTIRHEGTLYERDASGRVTRQAAGSYDYAAGKWLKGDQQYTAYNAFGEVSQRGIEGFQERFDYDAAGRLVRSNAGDGVWRYFVSDGAGRRTLTIENQGLEALQDVSVAAALAVAAGSPAVSLDMAAVSGMVSTIAVYDRRGLQVATKLPQRELGGITADGTAVTKRQSLETKATYNAFGELIETTDATGAVTSHAYNSMGRRILTTQAAVVVTGEDGVDKTVRPKQHYYYDLSGRLIGSEDANGHRTTRALLAGTGHDGTDALWVAEYHADSGVARQGYDGFGDRVSATDALGRRTAMSHDALGRVATVTRAGGGVERYAYDALGRETRHWNDLVGEEGAEWTDYDVQGRVTRKRAYGGDETRTSHAWSGAVSATGLGASAGGWLETVTVANDKTRTTTRDVFGHVVASSDLAGVGTAYGYDAGGRQVSRSEGGETVTTRWYNTGLVAMVSSDLGAATTASGSLRAVSRYEYDAAGRRVWEGYVRDGAQYQSAGASYDALGRMVRWAEAGSAAVSAASMTWRYDAVGNIRATVATRPALAPSGQVTTAAAVEARWFRYDVMDRLVLDGGTLVDGRIVRGSGVDMAYDVAGQRRYAARDVWLQGEVEVEVEIGGSRGGGYVPPSYDAGSGGSGGGSTSGGTSSGGSTGTDSGGTDSGGSTGTDSGGTDSGGSTGANTGTDASNGSGTASQNEDPPSSNPRYSDGTYMRDSFQVEPMQQMRDGGIETETQTRTVSYKGERREDYGYTADGLLSSVGTWESNYEDQGNGRAASTGSTDRYGGRAAFTYDAMGRQTGQVDTDELGATVLERETVWSTGGLVLSETTVQRQGSATVTSKVRHDYGDGYAKAGHAALGQVTATETESRRVEGGATTTTTSTTTNGYHWRGGPVLASSVVTGASASDVWYDYDRSGRLEQVVINDGRSRTVSFVNDLGGQALRRDETDNRDWQGDPHESWYRFAGVEIGHVGNNPSFVSDYATSVDARGQVPGSDPFANVDPRYGIRLTRMLRITENRQDFQPVTFRPLRAIGRVCRRSVRFST